MPDILIPGAESAPELKAYLAVPPTGQGPWPAVVVVHEALGLNDDTRQQADRLAAAGYLAVAPDLFTAGGALRCLRSTFRAVLKGEGAAFGDIEATRRWVADRADSTGRVGVLGFCMGGGFALLTATRGFDASAPNYGAVPENAEQVLEGACPVVASYGRRDRTLPGAAAKLERALEDAGVEHELVTYPGAPHSFFDRKQEEFADASEDAWQRVLEFVKRHAVPR